MHKRKGKGAQMESEDGKEYSGKEKGEQTIEKRERERGKQERKMNKAMEMEGRMREIKEERRIRIKGFTKRGKMDPGGGG